MPLDIPSVLDAVMEDYALTWAGDQPERGHTNTASNYAVLVISPCCGPIELSVAWRSCRVLQENHGPGIRWATISGFVKTK